MDGRGLRPDFFLQCKLPGRMIFPLVVEAKKKGQGKVGMTDLEKVGYMLKDAVDDLARNRLDVANITIFGMVIVGTFLAEIEYSLLISPNPL